MGSADIRTPEARVEARPDGSVLLEAPYKLPPYAVRATEWLLHWARATPASTFIAQRDGSGWRRLTYAEALESVAALAGALLERPLGPERPVLILSGNDIEHALMALACLHVGIPYAPISPAYALLSTDLLKLRQIVALTTPGLIFVPDAAKYARALDAMPRDVEIVSVRGIRDGITAFDGLLTARPSTATEDAAAKVTGDTLAKLLFTSGSTGAPKAVVNTHRMLCANQAMLSDHFGFLATEPPVLVDWLPWSHTFGGNHNFNLVLANGGTLYIDEGRPVPGQFGPTVAALSDVAPTMHLTVPKGWEELARHLRANPGFNRHFFSRLRVAFYAAASLSQPLWDELAALSREATGQTIPMVTGLGSTETAPMALATGPAGRVAGHVGLPVAGVQVKLAPVGDKLEARIRGPSVTPGYWRDPARTAELFDPEGYLCMGDALAWIDPDAPQEGLRFDGRLAEDFKLTSGTWVSVGPLRARLIAGLEPMVRDVVIAGHDRDYLAVLAVLAPTEREDDPALAAKLGDALSQLAASATGSATRVLRLRILAGPLSIDAGEVTDKGSLNQRAILRRRAAEVAALYAEPPPPEVICARLPAREGVA